MSKSDFVEKITKVKKADLVKLALMNKDLKKTPIEAYENQKDLIDKVIRETRREQMSDTKVYFKHPRYRHHMCDIFGGVYKFGSDWDNPERLVIYNDFIFLELKNDVTIKYKYMNFKRECFNLPVQCYYNKFLDSDDEDKDEDDSENDSENESLDSSDSD